MAIILAAGCGARLNQERPKQFIRIGGKPMLDLAVEAFAASGLVDGIVAVLPKRPEEQDDYRPHARIDFLAAGGATRMDSSYNGLRACPATTEIVLIHDAARPFVDARMIARCLKALEHFQGVVPVIPSSDTLAEVADAGEAIIAVPERGRIFRNQTPQVFRFQDIRGAYERLPFVSFTDDISLAFSAGLKCGVVAGSDRNIKITFPTDLLLAQALLAAPFSMPKVD